MSTKLNLDERMKVYYEQPWQIKLPMRMPLIIRVDGKNFHNFTKDMDKPFDETLILNMSLLAIYLCKEIATTVFAYVQSDEISLLLHNYQRFSSESWFGNNLQKLVSVSAGMASAKMSALYNKPVIFDSRAFVMPEEEVANYFLMRQRDATKNSIQSCAQQYFSHKELQNLDCKMLQELLFQRKQINWNDLPAYQKRGIAVYRNAQGEFIVDREIPIFSQDRDFIDNHLERQEE